MNVLLSLQISYRTRRHSTSQGRAFTLTELVVVMATLALLGLLALPALAGVQNKGGRAQCADNLRQIGMASMIYANEYRGWLPIWGGYDPAHPINLIRGEWYTRYVWLFGAPNSPVPTNGPPAPGSTSGSYENLGYLYRAGLAGDGKIFYCPAQWGTPLGASAYMPFLTSDSTATVRSSYLYNPRIVNPTAGNYYRRFQTTSQLQPHKLFAMDYVDNGVSQTQIGQIQNGISPSAIPHTRERGWNVLFTDGSVQFSRNKDAFTLATHNLVTDESTKSALIYDVLFNDLEKDH